MKHYLLLRFHPNFLSDERLQFTRETFARLCEQVSGIVSVDVFRNCIPRDSNMDLMVVMTLEGRDALHSYLDHPLHKRFVAQVGRYAVDRTTFDHEDEPKPLSEEKEEFLCPTQSSWTALTTLSPSPAKSPVGRLSPGVPAKES